MENSAKRATFATKLGILAATAGSAVGLGNIWRFPSQTAQDGGAIFFFIYIACVVFFGAPVVLAEFITGRAGKANASRAYKNLAPGKKFYLFGIFSTLTAFLILGYYMVVSGWTFYYLYLALTGTLSHTTNFEALFQDLVNDAPAQIASMAAIVIFSAGIVAFGVKKGIELSSKLMMPLMLGVMFVLCVRALTLPGAGEGLAYLWKPNFENAASAGTRIFTDALGQSFFSLSLGMGVLMVYASYFKKEVSLVRTTGLMAGLDTAIAVLAGIVIFPAAFALADDPGTMVETLKTGGPGLVFIAIPKLLQVLPAAGLWSLLFFLLLALAALTSAISLFEVVTAYIHEEFRFTLPKKIVPAPAADGAPDGNAEPRIFRQEYRFSRPFSVMIVSVGVIILGVLSACSLGENSQVTLFGRTFFYWLDCLSAKILLPSGGIFISLFVGRYLDEKLLRGELASAGPVSDRFFKAYRFILRWIAPTGIAVVLICGLL